MDEVELESACEALGLGENETDLVIDTHRRADSGPKLLRTILEHGGTYQGYVEIKIDFIRRIRPSVT